MLQLLLQGAAGLPSHSGWPVLLTPLAVGTYKRGVWGTVPPNTKTADGLLQDSCQQHTCHAATTAGSRLVVTPQQQQQQQQQLRQQQALPAHAHVKLQEEAPTRRHTPMFALPRCGRLMHTVLQSRPAGLRMPSNMNSSCSSRGLTTSSATPAAEDSGPVPADLPRRRRRSPTESSALRRTTESRAAIEDVAVMTKSQLMRRNKPWLAEQCWQQGLSHEGLKDDLVQRLLAWQDTDAGRQAAQAAVAAAAAARAAVAAAATAAPSQVPPPAAHAAQHTVRAAAQPQAAAADSGSSSGSTSGTSSSSTRSVGGPAPTAAAAASHAAADSSDAGRPHLSRPAPAACAVAVALPADDDAAEDEAHSTSAHSSTADCCSIAPTAAGTTGVAAAAVPALHVAQVQDGAVGWHQTPLTAGAAAAASAQLLLQQLQQQPRNAAIVAAARKAVEQHTQQLLSVTCSSSSSAAASPASSQSEQQQLVAELAATLMQDSSPESLAVLAKACYSREEQQPVLAASLAQAVAAVAAQLGPQEVFGVLRLLVEHLRSEAGDPVGFKTMDRGFRVLAESMIRCSGALYPVQLAEAVQLLAAHRYDDAFGLWLIAKEAAARLTEFDPVTEGGSVVRLLHAIADMCVADDGMTSDVAAAVGARRSEYGVQQLAAINAALARMGCTTAV